MIPRFSLAVGLTLACVSPTVCGCGAGTPKGLMPVRGTVTFASSPVPYGEVVFEPDAAKGNRGPQSRCPIEGGNYTTRRGFGAPIGPVIVTVTGFTARPTFDPSPTQQLFKPHSFRAVLEPTVPRLDIAVPTP